MNDSFHRQVINQLPTGYAYHRIICDQDGTPCDYEFLECNLAFERITSLSESDIVGRRITEVLPGLTTSAMSWIKLYGDIAFNDGKKEFEQFSEPLRRWYKVSVYSPQKYYFITHCTEISQENLHMKSLLNSIGALIYISDMETHEVLLANNYGKKIWGDIVGKKCWQTIQSGMTGPCDFCTNDKLLDQDGNPAGILEWEFMNALTERWYSCRDSAIRWTDGRMVRMAVTIDITERKEMENALRKSEEKHRLLTTQMLQGLALHEIILDEAGKAIDYRFLFVNKSFEKLTGLTQEKVVGKTVLEILPETEYYWIEKYGHVAMTGEPLHYENYSKELDKYFEVVAYSPRPQEFAVVISDITERKNLEASLAQEKKRVEITLRSVGDGVISTDKKGNVELLNKVAESLTGWTQEEARGKPVEEIFNIINEFTRVKCESIVQKVLQSGKTCELANHTILISKDGIETPIEDSAAPIMQENEEVMGVILIFRDFSEKKQKQEEILYLSYRDKLTGLYNRRFYEEVLYKLDKQENLPISIVIGDVNGLKLINDSFGHYMGDEFLKKAAELITKGCRTNDIIARLGGDEFVILLANTGAAKADQIVNRIKALSVKERIGSIHASISFGCATKENKEENIQQIFKSAEDHMYRNKLYESSSMRGKTIDIIMSTLFAKSNREMQHSQRVSEICMEIAMLMDFNKEAINQIRIAGLMHDIGKIGIDERILNKPQSLTSEEWQEIKRHPEIAYRILSSANEFSEMADYILEHHERWDGKGYPKGLKGEEISLQARIIAVADTYDAMISERPYRQPLSEDFAVQEIISNAGIQFDPVIVKVFINDVLKGNAI